MNIIKLVSRMKIRLLLLLAIVVFSTATNAAIPFPGKHSATVIDIEAANIIHVNIETWAGFRRNVRIILPNLALPGQSENAKECEMELAQMAYDFTVNFLSDVTEVYIKDMWMENSASEEAISSIYTNKGTLDNALRRERLAKPADLAHKETWCE